MANIATLAAKLVLDTAGFAAGFQKARSIVGQELESIRNAAKIVGAVGAGFTLGIAAGKKAVDAFLPALKDIDAQSKLADRWGLGIEQVQKLGAAAKLSNLDLGTIAKAMAQMGKTIGSGGLPLDVRLHKTVQAIKAIEDPAKRSAKAMEIFGKSGLAILQLDSKALFQSSQLIERFGLALSELDTTKATNAADAWDRMGVTLDALRQKAAVAFSPALEMWANSVTVAMGTAHKAMRGVLAAANALDDDSIIGKMANFLKGLGIAADAANATERIGQPASDKAGGSLDDLEEAGKRATQRAVRPGAFERGSVEAAQAIARAGGDPITALQREMQKSVRLLEAIRDSVDPIRNDGRGGVRLIEGGI
jgi:antitoxin component of RelBE/YafQ-DinJ toxin-antitoxin module